VEEWREELERRRSAFREIVEAHECDVALAFGAHGHGEHFRYLTNFAPALGDMWCVMRSESFSCVLDFDWQLEEARRRSGLEDWHGRLGAVEVVCDLLEWARPKQLAVAGLERLPVTSYERMRTRLPDTEILDVAADVARLRRRKSELEVRLLREAARLTDEAFGVARAEAREGMTERELAARVGQALGPEWSFSPTVISGNDDPIPIREPTERRLEDGDTVMLDIGAAYEGYQADASRTLVLGEPSAQQREVWDVVLSAYDAACAQVRAGVPCAQVHGVAAEAVEGAGYRLAHRIGHGIGLATSFEWPDLFGEQEPLEPGTTICIEPSIAVRGAGVMKLEDDLLVTDDGYELLTNADRGLGATA
jgi:Xaa-Pro aminopeptidase